MRSSTLFMLAGTAASVYAETVSGPAGEVSEPPKTSDPSSTSVSNRCNQSVRLHKGEASICSWISINNHAASLFRQYTTIPGFASLTSTWNGQYSEWISTQTEFPGAEETYDEEGRATIIRVPGTPREEAWPVLLAHLENSLEGLKELVDETDILSDEQRKELVESWEAIVSMAPEVYGIEPRISRSTPAVSEPTGTSAPSPTSTSDDPPTPAKDNTDKGDGADNDDENAAPRMTGVGILGTFLAAAVVAVMAL